MKGKTQMKGNKKKYTAIDKIQQLCEMLQRCYKDIA
jgi:hypothetical protein